MPRVASWLATIALLGCASPPPPVPPPPPSKPLQVECSVMMTDDEIVLRDVSFDSRDSCCLLRGVARVLREHPSYTRIAVEVHTDERGPEEVNARLSQEHAQALVEALVGLGVARSRLWAIGVGEVCPLDLNHNPNAWAKNRRVMFNVIDTDGESHGRQPSCNAKPVAIPPIDVKLSCD